jgi:hypothetical protein
VPIWAGTFWFVVDAFPGLMDDAGVNGIVVAANADGIPYDEWWLIWGALAFVVGPALVVWVWRTHRQHLLMVVLPVPLLLAMVFLGTASSCTGLRMSPERSRCVPSEQVLSGWIAIVMAIAVYGTVAVYLALSDYRRSRDA